MASPTAVLRRSSRAGSIPQAAHSTLDTLDRPALVARLARQLELVEDRAVNHGRDHRSRRRALQREHRDVVLLFGVGPSEALELRDHAVDELPPAGRRADGLLEAREPEHLALRVVRLGDAVGMQEDAVSRLDHGLVLLVRHLGHQAERHAAGAQLDHAVRRLQVREVVAGVREAEQAAPRVEHGVEAGDEHLLRHIGAEVVVHALEHGAGVDQTLRGGPQHAAGGRHHERRGNALVGHVPDQEHDAAVVQGDHVVEVAAHLTRRAIVGRHLPSGQIRQLPGQEVLLDQAGDLELLLEALARRGLGLLLAHELADSQSRRRLGGQAVEELAIVGGVVLLREARAEVEHTDQLALAHERDGELHTGCLELAQRGRVELERVDVDGPGNPLEVGEQGIVGSDVDRRRLGRRRLRRTGRLRLRRAAASQQRVPEGSSEGRHRSSFYALGVRKALRRPSRARKRRPASPSP